MRDSYGTTITQYVNRLAGKEMDIVWAVAQSKPQRPFVEHIEEVKPGIAATGLLPNLTFENLVEGQANQMAFASRYRWLRARTPCTTRFSFMVA